MGFLRRRLVTYLIVIIAVLNLDFFVPRLAPGNPAEELVGSAGIYAPPAAIKLLETRFGLNEPLGVQYYVYLKDIFATWPPFLGISYQYYPETVWNLFITRIGWTGLLIVASLILSVVLAYIMTGFASLRRGGKFEVGSLYFAISAHAIPVYWTGMILIWAFGVWMRFFPAFGSVSVNVSSGSPSYYFSVFQHAVLPVTAMTLSILGENYLVLRGSIQEVLQTDYVLAAKARGLRDRVVSIAYILRNSLLPLVSVLAFSLSSLVGRAILVEAVFGYPGVGDLIVDGIANRDYPVIEGTLLLLTVMVVVGGLLGDLLLVRLDPRIRKETLANVI